MLPKVLLRFRLPILLGLHLVLIPFGYWLAFAVRFDLQVPPRFVALFWSTMPLVLGFRLASFAVFGLFRGWWRHAGMRDLTDLVVGTSVSSGAIMLALFLLQRLEGIPRSILLLDWAVAILLFGGIRFTVRAYRERRILPLRTRGKRTLIIGAGSAAERLIRESQREQELQLWPVALLDDDPEKRGMRIHGVSVVGTAACIGEVAARLSPEMLVIAIPSATRQEMQSIVSACLATGIEFKIVPSVRELLGGGVRQGQLRDVQLEDLLGREAVHLDLDRPRSDLDGSTVLVTGGAGSIGSELARQIARSGARCIILLDQGESPLYFIDLELRRSHPEIHIIPVVADITDQARMELVFERHRPEYVFHAAAYKHVPLMESNPVEAVRNNVLGTLTVSQLAARFGARKFVLISTDKAVYPASVMGATKRIAEQIVLGWPTLRASGTDFRAVRFGNVLGSEGSVIPLFRRQLAAGQPLTVTDPGVTRYFMTIPEAVQLVLQASALPEAAGRICMLDMGQPVRIVDLAENLIRLSGLEPYRDVPIVFTGLRPGEKMHEELASDYETSVPTPIEQVRVLSTQEPDAAMLAAGLDRLGAAAALGSDADCLCAICELVPECVAPLRERGARAQVHN